MKHNTLSILVENSAGVLSQVIRLFSRKGYNIDSLAVGETHDPAISRITVVLQGDSLAIRQISSQLHKLIPVHSVKVLDPDDSIERELIFVKVKADSRSVRDEIIQLVGVFRAHIIDIDLQTVTVSIVGAGDKSRALLNLLDEFGIMEIARTGMIALERGATTIYDRNKTEEEYDYGKHVL